MMPLIANNLGTCGTFLILKVLVARALLVNRLILSALDNPKYKLFFDE
jgi:hypothetical protein